jgi:multidrug efflux system membrane fusion protein
MEQPLPTPSNPPSPGDAPTPRRRRLRWGSVVAVVVLVAVAALAWYLTHRERTPAAGASAGGPPRAGGPAGGGRGGPPSTVGVAPARHADIPVIVEALGTVTSAASVTVTPQVSGVITQVLYKEGQMVQKGQVLATIDPKPFETALAQAAGARQRDLAQLEAARQQLERYQVLLKQDSIARQTVDTQDALVQQLAGTVAVDRANEDAARLNLQWTHIVAPVSGRVGLRTIDAGNYIAAGAAAGVATITQVSPIDVAFSIPQLRVPEVQKRIAAGATLPVTAWDSGRTQQLDSGRFSTLDNQIDVTTGTVKAKARFANAAGTLFPNQFVNVRLLLNTVDAAVVVPVTALRHGPNGGFVWVMSPERLVSMRPVTAGLSGVSDVAITSGLQVGEIVVTEGGDRLKDGARVQTAADRPASGASGARGGRRGAGASGAGSGAWAGAGSAPAGGWAGRGNEAGGGGAGRAAASAPGAAPVAPTAALLPLPTAEQRQRMLDAAKDEPEQLARRKSFLEALDRGDPAALQRWQQMAARRAAGEGGRP